MSRKYIAGIITILIGVSLIAPWIIMGSAAASERNVGSGDLVFQGESEISLEGNYTPEELINIEGYPLELPVSVAQPMGIYQSSDQEFRLAVVEAKVTDFELLNKYGEDNSGGVVRPGAVVEGVVEYNFGVSESIEVRVTTRRGLDVTQQLVTELDPENDQYKFIIDTSDIDPELSPFTVTVEGEDDLDFGEATQSTTLAIQNFQPSITSDDGSVVQGEHLTYAISGAAEGATVSIHIDPDMLEEGFEGDVFRDVGDVESIGTSYNQLSTLYSDLEIDNGQAVGQISTDGIKPGTYEFQVFVESGETANGEPDATMAFEVEWDEPPPTEIPPTPIPEPESAGPTPVPDQSKPSGSDSAFSGGSSQNDDRTESTAPTEKPDSIDDIADNDSNNRDDIDPVDTDENNPSDEKEVETNEIESSNDEPKAVTEQHLNDSSTTAATTGEAGEEIADEPQLRRGFFTNGSDASITFIDSLSITTIGIALSLLSILVDLERGG